MKDVNYLVERYHSMLSKKMKKREKYEEVNRYVRQEGSLFEEDQEDYEDRIYEATAPNAARLLASLLKGIMWPSSDKSFSLKLVKKIPDTKENKDWVEDAARTMAKTMDDPKSGHSNALEENLYDQVTFGSAGLFISEDDKTDVRYTSWSLANIVFDEGENSIVNTVYFTDMWSVKKIVETYGEENVSDEIKDAYSQNRLQEQYKIIQAIEPKIKNGKESLEYVSITFEYDSRNILKEAKFFEMPCPVVRFYKNSNSLHGRSPSLDAMPSIKELNRKVQLREYLEEQEINPALGYISTAFGGDVLDISPNSLNPFNELLSANSPVFRIIPPVNLQVSDNSVLRLEEKIAEAFGLDRLLNFNNQTQMTLGEAQIRDQIKGQSNSSMFSRQITELFTPMIERTFNILFRKGKFGVVEGSDEEKILLRERKEVNYIPKDIADLIQKGENFYEIEYSTPASRMRSAEELNGLIQSMTYFSQLAQVKPEILLWINEDMVAKNIIELTGSPKDVLNAKDIVDQIKQAQAEAQALQQQQLQESNDLTLEKQEKELQSA